MSKIEIILNGKSHPISPTHSVADLVEDLNLTHRTIAIAVNRTIIRRDQWQQQTLHERDQVDVVHAIGGG